MLASRTMLLDRKSIGVERYFVAGIAWEWAGVKNTRVCIVSNISEIFKKFKISRSKIFLQDEHLLCHRIAIVSVLYCYYCIL